MVNFHHTIDIGCRRRLRQPESAALFLIAEVTFSHPTTTTTTITGTTTG